MAAASPAQLRTAFLRSSYGADKRAYLRTRPQGFCPEWASERYTILTAWNPEGRRSSEAKNQRAQRQLGADLQGYARQRGHNGSLHWREETWIVGGLRAERARQLGQKYRQVAVIVGEGERVGLLWCVSGKTEWYWWGPAPEFQ